jgi:hypothetical protein
MSWASSLTSTQPVGVEGAIFFSPSENIKKKKTLDKTSAKASFIHRTLALVFIFKLVPFFNKVT